MNSPSDANPLNANHTLCFAAARPDDYKIK